MLHINFKVLMTFFFFFKSAFNMFPQVDWKMCYQVDLVKIISIGYLFCFVNLPISVSVSVVRSPMGNNFLSGSCYKSL